MLLKALEWLKWNQIAIPMVPENEEVPGLLVGKAEYVEKILEYIPEGVNWNDDTD